MTDSGDRAAVMDRLPAFPAGLLAPGYPKWDETTLSVVVKRVGPWIVSVAPMMFNDRVLISHQNEWPRSWCAGYCYDKGPAAFLAAAAWDPEAEDRPVGFKKIAAEGWPRF